MRILLEVFPLFLLVTIPISVHAGMLASLIGVLESTTIVVQGDEPKNVNAQAVSLLKAAQHTDPNPAKGGGDILVEDGALVSDGGRSGENEMVNTLTSGGEISVYVVREADTLSQIAEMFGVSKNTILWANDIKKADVIQPGMTLVILPITGVRHVVKEGDTLASIAKKYEGDVDDIIAYNQLASAQDIKVGDTVVVPGGSVAVSTPPKKSSSAKSTGSTAVVVSGEGSAGFVNPVPGAIKTQGIHGYNAVDLAAPAGTSIRAAASGDVIVSKNSGWNGGYGNYVVIKHANGTQTLYAHMTNTAVAVGERVTAGETIGYVGATGKATGNHLHFEVRGARNPF